MALDEAHADRVWPSGEGLGQVGGGWRVCVSKSACVHAGVRECALRMNAKSFRGA